MYFKYIFQLLVFQLLHNTGFKVTVYLQIEYIKNLGTKLL